MWQAMQLISECAECSYAVIVSSCTLWQPSEQNQRVEVTPRTGIMTAAITRTATSVQMM